jgi:hypothetical protein
MIAAAVAKATATLSEGIGKRAQLDSEVDLASRNAEMAGAQSAEAEDAQRRVRRDFLGRQRAAIAESGMDFAGSAVGLAQQSAIQSELDALNVRYEGTLKRNQFLLQKSQAKAARTSNTRSMYLGMAGDILSGFSGARSAMAGRNEAFRGQMAMGGYSRTVPMLQHGSSYDAIARRPIGLG